MLRDDQKNALVTRVTLETKYIRSPFNFTDTSKVIFQIAKKNGLECLQSTFSLRSIKLFYDGVSAYIDINHKIGLKTPLKLETACGLDKQLSYLFNFLPLSPLLSIKEPFRLHLFTTVHEKKKNNSFKKN